jgi:hypothetical protein
MMLTFEMAARLHVFLTQSYFIYDAATVLTKYRIPLSEVTINLKKFLEPLLPALQLVTAGMGANFWATLACL